MKRTGNSVKISLVLTFFMVMGLLLQAQGWEYVVGLKDRRGKNGSDQVRVGSFRLTAYYTTSKVGKGSQVPANKLCDFKQFKEGYIKVYIDNLQWVDPTFKEGDRNWKVIFNPTWLNTTPPIWKKAADKKRVMIGYYTEYLAGNSTPPPIIFTVSESGEYEFRLGYKILTPQTTKEKPNYVSFSLSLKNIGQKKAARPEPPKPEPDKDKDKNKEGDMSEQDLEKSIQNMVDKGDLKGLKKLMGKFPDSRAVREAGIFLEIKMGQTLSEDGDSTMISTAYKYFPAEEASPSELLVNAVVGENQLHSDSVGKWRKGVFIAHTKKKYTLEAAHTLSPKFKSSIEIDPSVSKLRGFSYQDASSKGTTDSSLIRVRVNGGGAPFSLFFYQRKKKLIIPVDKPFVIYSRDTVIEKSDIATRLKIQGEGDFSITLFDKIDQKEIGTNLVFIAPPPLIPFWLKIVILAGTLVAIIAAIIVRRQQRKRDEEMDKSLAVMRSKPKMKQKPELNLGLIFKESAVSLVMLNDEFIQDIEAYLRDKKGKTNKEPFLVEGLVMGRIMKFDHNTEQFHVQLERFERLKVPKKADFYHDRHDEDAWPELVEIEERNPELQRLAWLQTGNSTTMSFSPIEQQLQEEQFAELFQMAIKLDSESENNTIVFLSRTLSGKMNNPRSLRVDAGWTTWDELKGD